MKPIKTILARKAVKSTARHTAHGTASKLKRDPLRAGRCSRSAARWACSPAG